MNRSVAAAGGVLMLGGLVFGGLTVPLADYGCEPAFASQAPIDGTIEVTVACAAARSDRQNVAYSLLVIGLAAVTGAVAGPRGRLLSERQSAPAWLLLRDPDQHERDAVPEPRS